MKNSTKPLEYRIAKQFSAFPAGITCQDGPYSGELLSVILATLLTNNESVVVLLDGTMGYGSSFLKSAFGGLVLDHGFSKEALHKKLSFRGSDPGLIVEIWMYINQ